MMANLDVRAVFADVERERAYIETASAAVAQRAQEWLKELEGALSPLRVLDPRVLGEDRPEFAVQNGKLLLVGRYPTDNTLEELVTTEVGVPLRMVWERYGGEPLVEIGDPPVVVTLIGLSQRYGLWGEQDRPRAGLVMTDSDQLLGIAVRAVCGHLCARYYWPKDPA